MRVKSDAEKPSQPSEEGSEPARWRPRYDGDRSSWRADAGPQCGTFWGSRGRSPFASPAVIPGVSCLVHRSVAQASLGHTAKQTPNEACRRSPEAGPGSSGTATSEPWTPRPADTRSGRPSRRRSGKPPASASNGPETLQDVPKLRGTSVRCPRVDSLTSGSSPFRAWKHGSSGSTRQRATRPPT